MGFATILWSLAAGVSLTLAVMSGSVGMTERRDPASLTLFVLGVAVAASAYLELFLMHSATASEYGEWVRWYHVPFFVAVVAQLLFIHYYLGTGRPWLMWTIVAMRLVLLVVNFAVDPNFNFSSITELSHLQLFGERVSAIGAAVPRAFWQKFAVASMLLLVAYLVDAAVRRWRMGEPESKRKALAIGLGIVAPWLFTMAYNQLIIYGVVHTPVTNLLWFLGALLVMTFELTRDYVLSRRALVELTDLQRQLMQLERVSVLGQLSSALAHELAQPLTASATNAVVALKCIENDKPDLKELRAILTDIGRDSHRAAELIARMRQLIKTQTIEMRPVRMEDVVQEVLALIRAEAAAKSVALSLFMQPNLPRVLGDRVHLSQVLINLIMNSVYAVQTRPPEARRIVVEARANDQKGEVEMTVRDSGPGIPDATRDKVFVPFFTTKPEGLGIGLALSRTIIEAHGGRLWMDVAAQQEGAIFRFTLQRA